MNTQSNPIEEFISHLFSMVCSDKSAQGFDFISIDFNFALFPEI